MRKKLIAGNWKMNKTLTRLGICARFCIWSMARSRESSSALPTGDLDARGPCSQGNRTSPGAQDHHWEKDGAFTGEISAGMLKAVGVTHVIIGHSERRQYLARPMTP